jgi:Cu+-exporting ATPase
MSQCCHVNVEVSESSAQEEQAQYRSLLLKSVVSIVVGSFFFLGPFTGLFPVLDGESVASHVFWPLSILIVASVIFYSGRHFYVGAYQSLKLHQANMDTLVTSGTFAAWFYSALVVTFGHFIPVSAHAVYLDTATLVIGFVLLGSALEMKARGQTNAAIEGLMALAPKTAVVVRAGEELSIAIDKIKVGDTIRLHPGDKVPVDGEVVEGDTAIDESMLTGEPLAVKKKCGDTVYTGTVNQKGSVLYRATHVGADTALSHIIETVQQAQRSKPKIGKLTDKIASIFAPIIIILALLTALVWMNFGPAPITAHVLLTSMAVLLISCPCALGLATPISIMLSVGRAAQHGIIVRNGDALQKARQLTTIVLDKTGTITEGKPSVTDMKALGGISDKQLMAYALSIEANSEHPLADAIVEHAQSLQAESMTVSGFEALSGLGVQATIQNETVLLGNRRLMDTQNISCVDVDATISAWMQAAKTPVFIAINGQLAGVLAIADSVKSDSKELIEKLQAMKLRVIMLTGDAKATAMAVATQVGIDYKDVIAEVMPSDKDQVIASLIDEGATVAMCGDGINDAAALARAHVGFAIGSGADVAIDSADMVLMTDSLAPVLTAISLSRATMRNIKQNLFGAFIYNICGIPIAAGILFPFFGVLLSPIVAGIAMAASSLTVVINANRLRWAKLS